MTSKLRVLVVDDSAFMRSIITRLITQDERFEVVGKATNGREAITKVKELKPDLVTMDIEMPEMNGLEALGHIMKETPVPVIMLSSLTEAGARETMKALELGAIDFMPKAMQDAEQNLPGQGKVLTAKLWAASKANKHHFRRRERLQAHLRAPLRLSLQLRQGRRRQRQVLRAETFRGAGRHWGRRPPSEPRSCC